MKLSLPDGSVEPRFALSDAQIAALQERAATVEELAYVHVATGGGTVLRREGLPPRRVRYAPVSPNFFSLLGLRAQQGRTLVPEDVARDVVVLSERAWRDHFGGDPGLVGRTIRLGSGHYQVVGVLPGRFRWLGFSGPMEFWMPGALEESRASPFYFNVASRWTTSGRWTRWPPAGSESRASSPAF